MRLFRTHPKRTKKVQKKRGMTKKTKSKSHKKKSRTTRKSKATKKKRGGCDPTHSATKMSPETL